VAVNYTFELIDFSYFWKLSLRQIHDCAIWTYSRQAAKSNISSNPFSAHYVMRQ